MKKIILFIAFLVTLLAKAQVPTGGDLVGLHNVAATDLPSITGPIIGSILYNATDEKIYVYKVSGWTTIGNSEGWKLDGNTITSTDFLGSTNTEDVVFKANSDERIRIKENIGQILINKATAYKDHPLILRANGNDILAFQDNTGTPKWHWNIFNGGLNFSETDVQDYRLFLQYGGNVGLGTSTPGYKLEVNGTAKIEDTPTITTATKALVKNPSTGQISEQIIPSFSSNKSYVQTYTGSKSFGSGNAILLNLFPEVTIQAGKKVKIDLYVPTRDNSTSWGGLYVNINAKVNGTWYNLGNTGYDGGVMSYSATSIHALNHEMLLDFITNLSLPNDQSYTLQFELTARSYNGTTYVNQNHDINRIGNNLGSRGSLQTWASNQNYCHIVIQEKDL